jgi:hypothetical protein
MSLPLSIPLCLCRRMILTQVATGTLKDKVTTRLQVARRAAMCDGGVRKRVWRRTEVVASAAGYGVPPSRPAKTVRPELRHTRLLLW